MLLDNVRPNNFVTFHLTLFRINIHFFTIWAVSRANFKRSHRMSSTVNFYHVITIHPIHAMGTIDFSG